MGKRGNVKIDIVGDQGPRFEINNLWAFVSVHGDKDEGVCAAQMPDGTWAPLVGADYQRINAWRPYAQQIADASGRTVKLVKFSKRTEIERFEPE